MKDKWQHRERKRKNKKKFKDYANNIKSVTMLAYTVFGTRIKKTKKG
tara:strand:- start:318 stop:458 length:141 start_codon:yes stop_codon:yes gene_type:complete